MKWGSLFQGDAVLVEFEILAEAEEHPTLGTAWVELRGPSIQDADPFPSGAFVPGIHYDAPWWNFIARQQT